ncbi:MAG: hypothetical protein U0Q16_19720 [Bryobacteraceae bacterium]
MKRLLFALASVVFAQPPDGRDVSTAVPITFGQAVDDIVDLGTKPRQIYKVTMGRGQRVSGTMTIPSSRPAAYIGIYLFPPTTRTLANLSCGDDNNALAYGSDGGTRGVSFDFLVPAEGDYYVAACVRDGNGVQYRLQVNGEGAPIATSLPAQAGCLFGQVDFIEYSLRLIAMNLPDRLSIGGQEVCATCTAKPPIYEPIVTKMENAMRNGLKVEACYDDKGNIFKLKLQR